MNLLTDCKLDKVADSTTTATSTVNSSIIDMQGYEGVIFITNIVTANAGNFLKAQQGAASNMSDAADLAGSRVDSNASDEMVALCIHKPVERYVRASVVRAGATTVLGEIYALRYGARTVPKDNSLTGTGQAKVVVSPAEGTA